MTVRDFVEVLTVLRCLSVCLSVFCLFIVWLLEVLHGERRSRSEHDPILPERPDGDVGDLAQSVGGGAVV